VSQSGTFPTFFWKNDIRTNKTSYLLANIQKFLKTGEYVTGSDQELV
jgi:hypothetical protein